MSLGFKLLSLLLIALSLFGAGLKTGIDHQQGVFARQELQRLSLEAEARAKQQTIVKGAAERHEAVKTQIQTKFITIEKEVFRDIQSNPDLYARSCFTDNGMRQLSEAIVGSGDRREPAPAVPASGPAR